MTRTLYKMAAFAVLMGAMALPVHAQLSAERGAISIDSDKLEVFDDKNQAIFTGQVDAIQDDARLRADKLDVRFENTGTDANAGAQLGSSWGDVKTLIATGNVFYVTPKQVAKAEKAVYDVVKDQVIMTGNVVVTQGKNVIRGDKLILQISTGRAVFDATQSDGATSGRVRAAFFPAKKADATPDE